MIQLQPSKLLFTAVAFFFFSSAVPLNLYAEENIVQTERKAAAYWQAHDYAEASTLYEQLLERPLTDWQHARVLYNLGTTRLAQHQSEDALTYFEQIHPVDLSIPSLGRDLFLNEGIAFFLQIKDLASWQSTSSLDQQALLATQSLLTLSKAQQLDCEVQQQEGEKENESSQSCKPTQWIAQWMTEGRLQREVIRQKQRNAWLDQASVETVASLIRDRLQELVKRFKSFQNENLESLKNSYFSYFTHQAEALKSLWESIQKKKLTAEQKNIVEEASTFFKNSLQDLASHDLKKSIEQFNQSIQVLSSLTFDKQTALPEIHLNYNLLLLEESFSQSAIRTLQTSVKKLKVASDQEGSLKLLIGYLQRSEKALQEKRPIVARFYLLAAGDPLTALSLDTASDPTIVLAEILEQANRALQLTFLRDLMEENSQPLTGTESILKSQQTDTLKRAALFIPAVLKAQKESYEQVLPSDSRCQESPWDQIIPLFDHGYRAAQAAEKKLLEEKIDFQTVLADQKQTVKDWQQALDLLLHPPQQGAQGKSGAGGTGPSPSTSATSKDLNETFRLIQEMYMQDQAQPNQGPQKEMHAW